MLAERSLKLEDIKELSQIWYELEVLEEEPVKVEEKFYALVERISPALKPDPNGESDRERSFEIWEDGNRSALLERLTELLRFDPELASLFQQQCLELVKSKP